MIAFWDFRSLPNNRITEEDAFVPTKEQFAIFPVGDKPLFPARRKMGSKGWQIGLRDYSDSKKLDPLYPINGNAPSKLNSNVRGFDSLPQLTNPRNFQLTDHDEAPRAGSSDAASPALMRQRLNRSSTDNSFFVRGMEPFVDLEKPAWPDRPRSINSRLSRSQYELQELPDVSSEQARKYFGEEAIQSFFDTYKQLQSRGKVLLGGYEELQGIIHQSAEDNVLNESVRVLENSGVLTPRGDNNFSSSRNASFALNSVLEESDDVASFFNRSDNGDLFGVQAEDSSSNKMLNLRLGLSEVEDEKNGSNLDAKVISEKIPKIVASGKLGQNIKAPSTPYSMLATASFPLLDTSLCSNSNGAGGSFSDNFVELYNSEDGIVSNYNVSSPRAVFLNGCLLHNIPPITISLIRKRISSTIDLAHMGIGNTVAQILASCLKDIPFLQMVDLTDNNLEDDGLTALINSIAAHPSIEKIDLSQNIIDGGAADALANFIGTPECRLTSLHMSDANIDDGECAHFVEVLMRNRHLKELDMSKNLIGKDENLNVVKADFVTGGESLAELISDGKCPLETLNLHWNMIRLKGAVALCDSLRQNRTLMHLDLSYNALGQAGALTLGNALTENKSLRNLNLANNSIDAIGCFTLCVGARENTSLEFMNLDGNPLGEQGGRILMKLAASDGHRLSISAVKCDFLIRSETKLKINGKHSVP